MSRVNPFVIGGSITFAAVLDVISLPAWLAFFWPQWVCLLVIYWAMTVPRSFGVLSAWFVGVFIDVMHTNPLGQNSMALSLVAYFSYLLHLRVRIFTHWQQCLMVFMLVGIYLLVMRTLSGLFGHVTESLFYYLPALVSGLLWPVVVLCMQITNQYSKTSIPRV